MRILKLHFVFILLFIFSCSEEIPSYNELADPYSNFVTSEGKILGDGLLTFPPGAVNSPVQILAKKIDDFSEARDEWENLERPAILVTENGYVVEIYDSPSLELWPKNVNFLKPVVVRPKFGDYFSASYVFERIENKDPKYGENWTQINDFNSGAFSTTKLSKYLFAAEGSKEIYSDGDTYRTYPYGSGLAKRPIYYAFRNNYRAIIEPSPLSFRGVVLNLFFVNLPNSSKSFSVFNAFQNGFSNSSNDFIEIVGGTDCSPSPCSSTYYCVSGRVDYLVQNNIHMVLFRNVILRSRENGIERILNGYRLLLN
jgi:hypothetical protein